jgi:hypothetical protein
VVIHRLSASMTPRPSWNNRNGEATRERKSDENEIDDRGDTRSEDDRATESGAAKRLRASELLAAAKNRDLTEKELKILSVVQLAEYARIRQSSKKVMHVPNASDKEKT